MIKQLCSYLTDPVSREVFDIKIFAEEGRHVISGLLISSNSWYPIVNGIPRIVINELRTDVLRRHYDFYEKYKDLLPINAKHEWKRTIDMIQNFDAFSEHQKKTGENFAYEWKYIYKENDYEKNNFFHFMGPFIKEEDLHDKITLDVGCGSGRFTKWAALSGAKIAFGADLGESVEAAYQMTKDIENVCIVQADIYAMPFRGVIDIAYSIGVIHHLPEPKKGFIKLPNVLKPGGLMNIWVYNRRNNKRALYFYEPMRSILKKLPKKVLHKISYLPAFIVHLLNFLTLFFKIIGLNDIAKQIPFSYYANFPFNMKLNDSFDVLATPKSNYYYSEEIKQWFTDASLEDIKSYEHPEAGITCVGKYVSS